MFCALLVRVRKWTGPLTTYRKDDAVSSRDLTPGLVMAEFSQAQSVERSLNMESWVRVLLEVGYIFPSLS